MTTRRLFFILGLVAIAALALSFGVSGALESFRWAERGVVTSGVVTGYETGNVVGELTLVDAESLERVAVLLVGRVGSVGDPVSFTYRPDEIRVGSVWAEPGDATDQHWLPPLLAGLLVAGGAIWLAVSAFVESMRRSKQDTLPDP